MVEDEGPRDSAHGIRPDSQTVHGGIDVDVESAIRDACDLGYLVTLVPDACATYSQERHDNTLRAIGGYCRQVSTSALVVGETLTTS